MPILSFSLVSFFYSILWMILPEERAWLWFRMGVSSAIAGALAAYLLWTNPKLVGWDKALGAKGFVRGGVVGMATSVLGLLFFSVSAYFATRAAVGLPHILAQYAQKLYWSVGHPSVILVFLVVFGGTGSLVHVFETRKVKARG